MQVENQNTCYESNIKNKDMNQLSKLDERIQSIVKKEGYITCDINKNFISTNGGNYMGVLYEIDIKGTTAQGKKDTAIFLKTINADAIDIEIISLPNLFTTELFVYKILSKIIDELQEHANIPQKDRYVIVKSYEESDVDAIFLENLARRGFKTWYRMDVGSMEIVELCLKKLAKFHALSFVLEEKRPEFFSRKIKNVRSAFVACKAFEDVINKFHGLAMDCFDPDMRRKVGNNLKLILKKHCEYQCDESKMRCLCHGDYRLNNIMYNETNGKVTEVIPVDYQLIYYGCPMLDLFYFVYSATDATFRRTHLMHLKNLYYNTMDRFLQYFDMSVETVYPRKVFETDFEETRGYGLSTMVLLGPYLFVSEGDVPDITMETPASVDFKVDDRFRDRLKEDVQEFIELGYF